MRQRLYSFNQVRWQNSALITAVLLVLCTVLTACQRSPASSEPVADVMLYTQTSDQGKPLDLRKEFLAGERVRAEIRLNPESINHEHSNVWHIQWLRPDGRKRFKKQILHTPGESNSTLSSSIRLHARHGSGEYILQVFHFRLLVHEERFIVRLASDHERS